MQCFICLEYFSSTMLTRLLYFSSVSQSWEVGMICLCAQHNYVKDLKRNLGKATS